MCTLWIQLVQKLTSLPALDLMSDRAYSELESRLAEAFGDRRAG